jgi:prepilin-type N-terminal cleavage/methylation domain-containing protein
MRRLRRLIRRESGYSLIELVTVMAILGTILGALTTAFVQGSTAELEANRRVQAQLEATAAFDRLRRDIHCASSVTLPSPGIAGPTLTLSGCASWPSPGTMSWCTVESGNHYALYRLAGSSCGATGRRYADYLTLASIFTPTNSVAATSLAKVHVVVRVNVNPAKAFDSFELVDDIVLRNSTRT